MLPTRYGNRRMSIWDRPTDWFRQEFDRLLSQFEGGEDRKSHLALQELPARPDVDLPW